MDWRTTAFLFAVAFLTACGPKTANHNRAPSQAEVPFSLDELQQRTFLYFWELADTVHWQIPDRYPTLTFSSIAATGFGLTSYLVGVERGYITREQAAERSLRTLQALWALPQGPEEAGVSGQKGFFYHFLTLDEALRYRQVELSTIDTGLLMAGVLSAMSYFDGEDETEQALRQLAEALYRRVEWDWALNEMGRLSMGHHPEKGFISSDWRGYNEAMILLVMAIGSPTHPIPPESWQIWCETYDWATFEGEEHVNFAPLFGHQYSQMYIDFRGIQDEYMRRKGIDYFENSRRATLSNRQYCIRNPFGFEGYGENIWGLTACDGPANEKREWKGREVQFSTYFARGAAAYEIKDDGTIAPTAAGGSIPFAPEVCLPALQAMWEQHYDNLVGEYGFRDAFNLSYTFGPGNENGWFNVDYLGIDQGPILIQAENHRSGLVWELMKKNPYIVEGLKKAGFAGGWLENR
jgi:hypothetical protein